MPCLNLNNTRRRWQVIKLQRQAKRRPKQAPLLMTPPTAAATPAARVSEQTTLRVPHARKTLGSTATVSQTLTAAVSARMRAGSAKAATKTATGAAAVKIPAKPAMTAAMPYIPQALKKGATRAEIINAESQLGSRLFGPIPQGHRREFFHDQENIWIWHEDWQDRAEHHHQMTVRYEVRTSGVYKKISTGKYLRLEGEELDNFRRATKAYLYMIKKYLYQKPAAV